MKLLSIVILSITMSAMAQDKNQEVPVPHHSYQQQDRYNLLDQQLKIESYSTAIVPLHRVTFIGRMEVRIKRSAALFAAKSGVLRILADGIEIDCVQFYASSDRDWRSYVVNVGRTVRTLEFYNGLDRKVKIESITNLPSFHYSRVYNGNPSEVLDLSSQLIDITSNLEYIVGPDDQRALAEMRISASTLMNKVQVQGPLKVEGDIRALLALFDKHAALIQDLQENQLTAQLANEIDFVATALRRLVD